MRSASNRQNHSSGKPEVRALHKATGSVCPMRVLIVEDNLMNLRVLNQILLRMGFQPDIARNGGEAVAAIEKRTYDMIFMDLQMPVMDGITATHEIRARLGHQHPWITAFTANSQQSLMVACQECGMNDFISKPATPGDIEAAIRRAFQSLNDPSH